MARPNTGRNPAVVVSDMAKKYGDRFCLHIISVADTARGKSNLKRLASLTPCGVYVDASALADKAVLDKFAQDVFYTQEEELIVEVIEEVVIAAPGCSGSGKKSFSVTSTSVSISTKSLMK